MREWLGTGGTKRLQGAAAGNSSGPRLTALGLAHGWELAARADGCQLAALALGYRPGDRVTVYVIS